MIYIRKLTLLLHSYFKIFQSAIKINFKIEKSYLKYKNQNNKLESSVIYLRVINLKVDHWMSPIDDAGSERVKYELVSYMD